MKLQKMTDESKDYLGDHERGRLRRKWIEALRSGEYKQGRYHLGNQKMGFCCLGVACDALGVDYHPSDGISWDLATTLRLNDKFGTFCPGVAFYHKLNLVDVNDKTPAGFKRIASFIEHRPEAVFREV